MGSDTRAGCTERETRQCDLINAVAGALTLTGIGKCNPLVIHPDVLCRTPCRWAPVHKAGTLASGTATDFVLTRGLADG